MGFPQKWPAPNFGARSALVYEDLGRKLHSSLKGSTLSQNTPGSENLTKEFRERPWAVISASISPKKFLGQGWGIGFGTTLYALKRVSYGPGERIFSNALAFLRPLSVPPKFYPTLGALAPPFMKIQDGNSKFSSGIQSLSENVRMA